VQFLTGIAPSPHLPALKNLSFRSTISAQSIKFYLDFFYTTDYQTIEIFTPLEGIFGPKG
jgi:hypothetical protein